LQGQKKILGAQE